jgi:hypothetical protein
MQHTFKKIKCFQIHKHLLHFQICYSVTLIWLLFHIMHPINNTPITKLDVLPLASQDVIYLLQCISDQRHFCLYRLLYVRMVWRTYVNFFLCWEIHDSIILWNLSVIWIALPHMLISHENSFNFHDFTVRSKLPAKCSSSYCRKCYSILCLLLMTYILLQKLSHVCGVIRYFPDWLQDGPAVASTYFCYSV